MNKNIFSVAVVSMFLAGCGITITMAQKGNEDLAATVSPHTSANTATTATCTDSDKGADYFVKGSVRDTKRVGTYKAYDKCASEKQLIEYTCKNDSWHASSYSCEFGCKNGACLTKEGGSNASAAVNLTAEQINAFIDGYVTSVDVAKIDFSKFNSGEDFTKKTGAELTSFLAVQLKSLYSAKTDITDEESFQKALDAYLAGFQKGSSDTIGAIADGSLLKVADDEKVYVVKDGKKVWITTAEDFTAAGYDWKKIQQTTPEILAGIEDLTVLVKDRANKVYAVTGTQAMWIPNEQAFAVGGYDWKNVINTTAVVSETYSEGGVVEDEDGTLYYITANGKKMLISDQEVLNSYTSPVQAFEDEYLQTSLDEYLQKLLAANNNTGDSATDEELTQIWKDFVGENRGSISSEFQAKLDASNKVIDQKWQDFVSKNADKISSKSESEIEALFQEFLKNNSDYYSSSDTSSSSYKFTFTDNGGKVNAYTASDIDKAWNTYLIKYDESVIAAVNGKIDQLYKEFQTKYGYGSGLDTSSSPKWGQDFQKFVTEKCKAYANVNKVGDGDEAITAKAVEKLAEAWQDYLKQITPSGSNTKSRTKSDTVTAEDISSEEAMAKAWADYLAGNGGTTDTATATPNYPSCKSCESCIKKCQAANKCSKCSKCVSDCENSGSCKKASTCTSGSAKSCAANTAGCSKSGTTVSKCPKATAAAKKVCPKAAAKAAAAAAAAKTTCKTTTKYVSTLENVTLIQENGGYKVYQVVNGEKKWITTAEEFTALGLKWSDIQAVNSTTCSAIADAATATSTN